MKPAPRRYTLRKEERLCSKTHIDQLFMGGKSRSLSAFPLRAVYLVANDEQACNKGKEGDAVPVKILISVPKKHFKRAVKRNRVKRQIREAYRKNKYTLIDKVNEEDGRQVRLALIWLDNELHTSAEVEASVCNLLLRIGERL